ncbi:MAG: zinc ribbon domain-containing protein [Gaiellales bacterium]|nr:MAG: zinc ribbon domain-containing protein [Gaiellales bacterium]
MTFCPTCGHEAVEEGSSFCAQCGAELPKQGIDASGQEQAGPPEAPADESAEAPAAGEGSGEDEPADEAPTQAIPAAQLAAALPRRTYDQEGGQADDEQTAAMPAQDEPTGVMPAPGPPDGPGEGPGAGGQPPDEKGRRKKQVIYAAIALVAAATIAGSVIALLELSGDDKTPKTETVVKVKTVEVDPEAEPLEEPFTLKVDLLDGSIPDDLVDMEYLLAEIEIEVDGGDVYGMAQRPAISGDGSVMQGVQTTLEIKGTYRKGAFKGTWNFYRPYGMADTNAYGEIESAGEITRDEAACLLTGEFLTVTDDGAGDPRDLDIVTIYFDIES